jgi:hypothetical protein
MNEARKKCLKVFKAIELANPESIELQFFKESGGDIRQYNSKYRLFAMEQCPKYRRSLMRDKINDLVKQHGGTENFTRELENTIYNKTKGSFKPWEPDFIREYNNAIWEIYCNIKDAPRLIEVPVSELLEMDRYTLQPEKWESVLKISLKLNEDQLKAFEPGIPKETIFKCKRCIAARCTKCVSVKYSWTDNYSMQTRSADEACTVWAICKCCNHRWREQ